MISKFAGFIALNSLFIVLLISVLIESVPNIALEVALDVILLLEGLSSLYLVLLLYEFGHDLAFLYLILVVGSQLLSDQR